MFKTCTHCGMEKPVADFRSRNDRPGKLRSYCRKCETKTKDEWRKRNPILYKKIKRKGKQKNQRKDLLRKYGLTVINYEQLLNEQSGNCAICGRKEEQHRRLNVDHDHITGQIRGLLCFTCNTQLAIMENEQRRNQLIEYLKKYH